ncbi:MAG: hypothetical protein K6G03_01865 [Lachnospiraceae bacterium]|nr:hypothetical protein [Lachnospiraceae bacterium]
MRAYISDTGRSKVYHISGCPYEKRIAYKNLIVMNVTQARKAGLHACTCCSGLKGYMKYHGESIETYALENDLKYKYDEDSDTLYIKTDMGFWKIFYVEHLGFCLNHANRFDINKTIYELSKGEFHKQRDTKPAESPMKHIVYLTEHDRAKKIINDDYRKLPQKTKRQRKYYKIAKRREPYRQARRVDDIFRQLEAQSDIKKYSVC